jgi:trigger factor
MAKGARREQYQLPQIDLPDLQNLKVQVLSPRPPDAEDLIEHLHQKLRAQAPRREKKPGEPIELGDEVECDIVTVVDGVVLPGSVKQGALLEMREFSHLPGFIEQVLQMTTFTARTFELTMPADYPIEGFRGKSATFYVEARRAFQVDEPSMEDPVALEGAGLGGDIEQAMEAVAAEIDEEQGQQMLIEASQAVLDVVADRVQETVPEAAIDEELRLLWQRSEAPVLESREFSSELVEQALNDFLDDADLRAQAAHRIKVGLVLGALVREQNLAPSAEVMTTLLKTAADQVGVTFEEARESLAEDPVEAQKAGYAALYQTAVEYLMERAEVEVLDEPL